MDWTFVSWILLVGIIGLLWVIVLALANELTARSSVKSADAPKGPEGRYHLPF
jgi:hypothetical protein